jgi:hypothetical protein
VLPVPQLRRDYAKESIFQFFKAGEMTTKFHLKLAAAYIIKTLKRRLKVANKAIRQRGFAQIE